MTLAKRKVKFTEEEIETTVRVLMQSNIVGHWVGGEAKFLGIDLDTPEGKTFFREHSRAAAKRLIK